MIGFKVDKIKGMFFDRAKVMAAVRDSTWRNLGRTGAYVQKVAKNLIKTRKGTSKAGKPPFSHTGILKQFIFFGMDTYNRSVVIGPAATNQVFFGKNRKPVTGTVPSVLEYGGKITQFEVKVRDANYFQQESWVRADLRNRRFYGSHKMKMRYRTISIAARPYMGPALAKSQDKIAQIWKNSVIPKSA